MDVGEFLRVFTVGSSKTTQPVLFQAEKWLQELSERGVTWDSVHTAKKILYTQMFSWSTYKKASRLHKFKTALVNRKNSKHLVKKPTSGFPLAP